MSNLNIKIIKQLKDNYSYILYKKDNANATIIDPAESYNLIDYLNKNNLILQNILITHHHQDHTGGVEGLIKQFPSTKIFAPSKLELNLVNIIKEGSIINTNINNFSVIETPGHTIDHVILYDKDNKILFSGDTLFRLGCGRVFEGTYNQMYNSLKKINLLEDNTTIYCGHEYTLSNLKFLETVFVNHDELTKLRNILELEIKMNGRTIPFNLANEKKINPFLNQNSILAKKLKVEQKFSDIELFTFLRDKKNQF
ncbi:MAG: Hydroxyacylglutathione hydrolase [Alphaproteobacteria bacterium MarineAlpha5_Bin5]|nr:MAG: Hydroxyacylglutathione hydrolase [Alphaproteobacteria bacterium MarineAlpha5_Bin5]PPR52814.1 MAG: Hydroxyacylglutathione hydrolase [Alphaproteobacteria bacterium MarineAlpha5_Bin4]|tara:strand:+ start:10357 stop:11121 length:765 start_codon:yes stop_codon:yes gene_type:complete